MACSLLVTLTDAVVCCTRMQVTIEQLMEGLEQQLQQQQQQQGAGAAPATPPAAGQQKQEAAPASLAGAPSGPWMQALLADGDEVADAAELARLASESPRVPASAGNLSAVSPLKVFQPQTPRGSFKLVLTDARNNLAL